MFHSFPQQLKEHIYSINEPSFESTVLSVFDYQYEFNNTYQEYCKSLGKNPKNVTKLRQIPFLPVEFFKEKTLKTGEWHTEKVFKSSGTTGQQRSNHHVKDVNFYHQSARHTFENTFGSLSDQRIYAVLPSYLEQGDSSLISMVDSFIKMARPGSGYYKVSDIEELPLDASTVIFGVTYALLDLAAAYSTDASFSFVETGGMKGRRKEIIRDEFHHLLKESFPRAAIYSEYGMTELLSQAYGHSGKLQFPTWATYLIRDINDPFSYVAKGRVGGVNIIDLANVDTLSFIETKDLGKDHGNHLEVLGRFDNSDIRGCNLLTM